MMPYLSLFKTFNGGLQARCGAPAEQRRLQAVLGGRGEQSKKP